MNKKILTEWFVKSLIVIGVVVALYLSHGYVLHTRNERARALAQLEDVPNKALEATAQQTDLARYGFDVQRIEKMLITREDIVTVVSSIEQEGLRQGLVVQVPTIGEIQQVDEEGKATEEKGPVVDVKINISVDGSPEKIVAFVHSVEHLPYLLYLDSLSLMNKATVGGQVGALVSPEQQGDTVEAPPSAHGEATIILSVKNTDG